MIVGAPPENRFPRRARLAICNQGHSDYDPLDHPWLSAPRGPDGWKQDQQQERQEEVDKYIKFNPVYAKTVLERTVLQRVDLLEFSE